MLLGGCYAGAIVTPTPMPESSQLRPQTSISPQSGGEISIPMPEKPYTWHPLFVKESGMSNIFSMIFEPLIAIDSQLLPSVSIANSWEFDDEGRVIVRLRSGVQFHNSDTLTSGDVVFTFNTVLENRKHISQPSERICGIGGGCGCKHGAVSSQKGGLCNLLRPKRTRYTGERVCGATSANRRHAHRNGRFCGGCI